MRDFVRSQRPAGAPDDAIVLTFGVPNECAGMRLDLFVQRCIPRLSRMRAQGIVRACARRIDGSSRRPSDRVQAGEVVFIVRPRFAEPDAPQTFGVLYEDEHMVAVDKPAGLPVHPSATYHRNTLTFLLKQQYKTNPPHLAHRLDRETSGIVLCARALEVERTLKASFENREVKKAYLAIVRGVMREDSGVIDAPLAPVSEGLHLLMEVSHAADALPATTVFQVLERGPAHTLVRLEPHTGRQHQLRVHIAHLGHSIVGDKLYGPEGASVFMDYVRDGMTEELRERLGHDRQALHAAELWFAHPVSNAAMNVRSPLPDDMQVLWNTLGKKGETKHAPQKAG